MRKSLLALLLLTSCLVHSQQTIYVSSPNSKIYKAFIDSANTFNAYLGNYNKYKKAYKYSQMANSQVHEFSNTGCFCHSVYLDKVPRPANKVIVVPVSQIKLDTVTVVKWKTKVKIDTVLVEKVVRDTIKLLASPCSDTIRRVWFTTTDKTTMLMPDSTGKSMIPYIERRYYDYEHKLVGKLKLDPKTYAIVEE